ncbi:MAG: potassium-transporting ATPase subunit KdpC [Polyangiaceae bacterium]|nr:potassium-transporting ATPase subunit KdpC [Polyangiaceae bacterium]
MVTDSRHITQEQGLVDAHAASDARSQPSESSRAAIWRPALVLLGLFTILCGFVYPVVVTGIAQTVFPKKANGSLIERDGKIVGSSLIGQSFTEPSYFWGRGSATGPFAYNAGSSSGSNLGPTNPALAEAVRGRIDALRAADPDNKAPIPVDLVTASSSGLDPHISPAAAYYQVGRVARLRGLPEGSVRSLVEQHVEGRALGILGERHVNVLELNLALDQMAGGAPREPAIAGTVHSQSSP